jgi:hypothetical protein
MSSHYVPSASWYFSPIKVVLCINVCLIINWSRDRIKVKKLRVLPKTCSYHSTHLGISVWLFFTEKGYRWTSCIYNCHHIILGYPISILIVNHLQLVPRTALGPTPSYKKVYNLPDFGNWFGNNIYCCLHKLHTIALTPQQCSYYHGDTFLPPCPRPHVAVGTSHHQTSRSLSRHHNSPIGMWTPNLVPAPVTTAWNSHPVEASQQSHQTLVTHPCPSSSYSRSEHPSCRSTTAVP